MSADSELVLSVTKRLRDESGDHPGSCEVKEELARMVRESQLMFLEAQDMVRAMDIKLSEQDMMLKGVGL
jgi:hypothetical protein